MKAASTPTLEDKKSNNAHVEDVDSLKVADEKAQGDYSGATAKDDPVEIKLVRKLDFRIMPILWAMYFLNYVSIPSILPTHNSNEKTKIDRNAIANARLNNLEEDLSLVGTQYNTCISILFVGYDEGLPTTEIET